MKLQQIQTVLEDAPLASFLFQLPPKHLKAVTLYCGNDAYSPVKALSDEVKQKLGLPKMPNTVVVEDHIWPHFTSYPSYRGKASIYGMYNSALGAAFLPRSIFEEFCKNKPFGKYITLHEYAHSIDDTEVAIGKFHRDSLMQRRDILRAGGLAASGLLSLTSLGFKWMARMEKNKHEADTSSRPKYDHEEMGAAFCGGVATSSYLGLKYLERDLKKSIEAQQGPSCREDELATDAIAVRMMSLEEITEAMIEFSIRNMRFRRMQKYEINKVVDHYTAEIDDARPEARSDEKRFYLALALADHSAGTITREGLKSPKMNKVFANKSPIPRDSPLVIDRIINLKDLGIFDGYDTSFRLGSPERSGR